LNVLGLESDSTGSRSWHRGATDVRSGAVRGQRMCDYLNREGPDPKGKCLGPGPTQGQRRLTLRDQLRVSPGCNEIPYLRGCRPRRRGAAASASMPPPPPTRFRAAAAVAQEKCSARRCFVAQLGRAAARRGRITGI
jgi:hypothetical protein